MSTQLNRYLALSLLFILIFAVVTSATEGDLLWSRIIGGNEYDIAFSVIGTNDGGFLTAGYTSSFGAGLCDMWLVKTNAAGDTLWTRAYGTAGWEAAYSVVQTSDNGYLVVGDASSFNLLKVNAQGDSLWCCSFGSTGEHYLHSVIKTSDGGCLAVGSIKLDGSWQGDLWLVKVNAAGDRVWSRSYGSLYDDEFALDVIETTEGGYLLAGWIRSNPNADEDMFLLKTNSRGDSLWSRIYGGNSFEQASSILQTPDGGYLAAGYAGNFGFNYMSMWLVRMNARGDSLWSRTYNPPSGGDANARSLIETTDDNYLLAGLTGSGNYDVFVVKVNIAGDTLWTRTYGSGILKDQGAYAAIQAANGSYVIAGFTKPYGLSDTDMLLACLEGPAPGGEDCREEISFSAELSPSLQPRDFSLLTISPNPFNASTALSYQLPEASDLRLQIYDTAGRLVETLVDGWREAGAHEVTFDGSALPSGIYVYHFQAGGQVANGKLILLK